LDETTIHVDTILYLSLYYLVNDLVHLPNSFPSSYLFQKFHLFLKIYKVHLFRHFPQKSSFMFMSILFGYSKSVVTEDTS